MSTVPDNAQSREPIKELNTIQTKALVYEHEL